MSYTITSETRIEYNDILKVAQQATDIMFSLPENQSTIIYRRLNLHNDNLGGDLNKTSYTEYNVGAIVMPLLIDDRILQQGEMKPGDVELHIKPYINFDIDDTPITEPFIPQIDDEFTFNGIRYRIKLIRKERIGNTIVYLDCLCSRLENDMPETTWNENYREPVSGSRRGSGWD